MLVEVLVRWEERRWITDGRIRTKDCDCGGWEIRHVRELRRDW